MLKKYFIHLTFYTRLFLILLCIAVLLVSTLSYAYDDVAYRKGAYYFSKGDYSNAFKSWRPLAENADPAAQYSIALLYDQGNGVKKNKAQALKYLQLAVNQDLPDAQYYLAMKYYYGLDIVKNDIKSREFLIKAAKQDNLKAQFQLANFYDRGEGGDQDQHQATYWFKRAAENGYAPAQHGLAARFLRGKGINVNIERGVFWLQKAADQEDSDAQRDLAFMYYKGIGLDKNYKTASDLLVHPAEEGSAMAFYLLGEIYAQGGYGIKKDIKQAKISYKKAQQLGYTKADAAIQKLSTQQVSTQQVSIEQVATQQVSIEQVASNKPTDKTQVSHQSFANNQSFTKKPSILSSPSVSQKKFVDNAPIRTSDLSTNIENNARYFQKINDNYYTLQLLSSNSYHSITVLTDNYFDQQTYVLATPKNNKSAYLLSYGVYKNYDEAKQAIQSLPNMFQLASKPWIRKVKDIKKLMSNN